MTPAVDYTKAVLEYAGRDYRREQELSSHATDDQVSRIFTRHSHTALPRACILARVAHTLTPARCARAQGFDPASGRMAEDGRPWKMVDWQAEARSSCIRRTWRAKWNLHPRGPRWLPEIIRMTWYLQIINLVFSIQGGVDGDLGGPFFYSRTSCCGVSGTPKSLPSKFDVHYPKTMKDYKVNVTTIKACDLPILNRTDPNWSHSLYCPSWSYVKHFQQLLSADRNVYISAASLIALPMGAGLGDSIGRKPILVFSSIMGIKSHLCNLLSSLPWFIHHDPNAYVLYASAVLSGLTSGAGPVSTGMMVDLIPANMREQGFPVMAGFGVIGQIVVFGLGFYLLGLYLTSYTIFWEITLFTYIGCFLFQLFLLPESMPDKLMRPFTWTSLLPTTYYYRSIKMIGQQGLLIGVCVCQFLLAFTSKGVSSVQTNQLLFGPLEYTQQSVLIPGIILIMTQLAGSACAAAWLPRLGVWFCFFGGNLMMLLGMLGYTVWPILWLNYYDCWGPEGCPEHLWIAKLGPIIFGSLIIQWFAAFANPAAAVILSKAVGQEQQASVQAAFQLMIQISGMWAPKFYTHLFFYTNPTGWPVVYYGIFSVALNCVNYCIALFVYWWCVYRPEMAQQAKAPLVGVVESTANPRRHVGLVRSVAQSVNYLRWTSDDYRREIAADNYRARHGASTSPHPGPVFLLVYDLNLSRLD